MLFPCDVIQVAENSLKALKLRHIVIAFRGKYYIYGDHIYSWRLQKIQFLKRITRDMVISNNVKIVFFHYYDDNTIEGPSLKTLDV